MIKPVLKGEALLRNIHAAAAKPEERLSLWWLGQSGFLIQWGGTHLACDPFLSDVPRDRVEGSASSLVRVAEPALEPHQLDFVDVVTASDLQFDHLDSDTLGTLFGINPKLELFIPEAVREDVLRLLACDPDRITGLDDDLSETLDDITILGVAATKEEDRNADGRCERLGYIIQLGPWTVYHSGDVVPFEGLEERLRAFAIDVALLPVAGPVEGSGPAETLTPTDAARLAKAIDARLAIPCHFEMFDTDGSPAEEFARACERLEQPFRILRCGEPWSDRELEAAEGEEDETGSVGRVGGWGRSRPGGVEDDEV